MGDNTKKTILFMRGYFMPETAASNQMCVEYIQALSAAGYRVKVLCPLPTRGVSQEVRREYKSKKREQMDENILIRRFWLPNETGGAIKRAARYLMQNVYQVCYALTHRYDVLFLYSTPPTNGMIGGLLRKLKRKPFLFYLHDVFPDSLVTAGMTREGSMIWKLGRMMERFSYRNASHIIAVSNGIRENILKKGVPENKTSVVYNWVDENKIQKVSRENNRLLEEYGIDSNKFLVTYAGNLGKAQGVGTIIEAAEQLRKEADIHFIMIGNGAEEQSCKDAVSEKALTNVTFIPMQSPDRLSEVYSLGDISIVACKAGVGSWAMPSKVGSIMSAETAVLASFDEGSELCRIVDEYRCGVCIPPEDVESMAQAISKLKNYRALCEKLGRNGRAYLQQYMAKSVCTEVLVKTVASYI